MVLRSTAVLAILVWGLASGCQPVPMAKEDNVTEKTYSTRQSKESLYRVEGEQDRQIKA